MSIEAQVRTEVGDELLVRRFAENDEVDCFAELFARHRTRIYSACRAFFCGAPDTVSEMPGDLRTARTIRQGERSGARRRIADTGDHDSVSQRWRYLISFVKTMHVLVGAEKSLLRSIFGYAPVFKRVFCGAFC
jgi:hypothetical protein